MSKTAFAIISGSLEAQSIHDKIFTTLKQTEKQDQSIIFHKIDITQIPLYNQDVQDSSMPPSVVEARKIVKQSNALILTVPNHNGKVSAALKNAYDWLSRPQPQTKASVVANKIVGFITVSDVDNKSLIEHLKHMTQYCKCRIFLDVIPLYKKSQTPTKQSLTYFIKNFKTFISKQ